MSVEMSKDINKPEQLITEHIDIWTSSILAKSSRGRGSSKRHELYGISKLRELVLELAVRGKLVPQDANDEPASVLLEKITVEKTKLLEDGGIKKVKKLKKVNEDEKPFVIPQEWEWIRLGSIANTNTGYAFKSGEYKDKGVFVLRVTNINQDGSIDIKDSKFISEQEASTVYKKFQLSMGDVLLVMVGGSLGKIGIVSDDVLPAVLNQNMWKLDTFGYLSRDYFIYGLRFINNNQLEITKSTHGHLSQGDYLTKLIPLPPLAEQHRIVAKVNELMLLCDQLEQQTEASIDTHAMLVEVLLTTLTDSTDADELAQNWARISEYFDSLFTTEQSIESLKQTVLQLAVMGKLVPQNPDDETASVLLENIAKEKEQLIKDKKIKKQKTLLSITDEETPFELPYGWEWCCLGNLTTIRGGKRLPKGYQLTTEKTPYIYIRVTDMRNGSIRDDDIHYISKEVQSQISNYIITQDDIYMTIVGATIGKCGLVPSKFNGMNLTENAARIIPFYGVEKNYLFKCLDSSFAQKQFFDKTKQVGVQKMALNRLSSTKIPLPPLAEQHRIVAKVDELMAICDQLKEKLQQSQETQVQLTDALIDRSLG